MTITPLIPLLICILVVAILYSSVGHGGASGYIAALALFSLPPAVFKPTALILNILVAAIATYSFARAGHFSWRLFWPFVTTSIPCSFIGGYLSLPQNIYNPLVGTVLLTSAFRLIFYSEDETLTLRQPSIPVAMIIGAGLGLLAGLTGVGGGIFLSPLLLFLKWGRAKEVSSVAALFILVNSIAGLLGHLGSLQTIPSFTPLLAVAALSGGIIGSVIGSRHLPIHFAIKTLSIVLTIAGFKLFFV